MRQHMRRPLSARLSWDEVHRLEVAMRERSSSLAKRTGSGTVCPACGGPLGSEAVRMFFHRLGVSSGRAHAKRVPGSIFIAPTDVQAAFLRGLFGADGCVSENRVKSSRYAGLGSTIEALLKDVQRLLNSFGIKARIYATRAAHTGSLSYTRRDGTTSNYVQRQLYDLRIQGQSLERFAEQEGEPESVNEPETEAGQPATLQTPPA
jgi:hypothetical protein